MYLVNLRPFSALVWASAIRSVNGLFAFTFELLAVEPLIFSLGNTKKQKLDKRQYDDKNKIKKKEVNINSNRNDFKHVKGKIPMS